MRFCMGWSEWVSERDGKGGEVLGWEWGDLFMVDWDTETDCRGRERERANCGIIFVFVSESVQL